MLRYTRLHKSFYLCFKQIFLPQESSCNNKTSVLKNISSIMPNLNLNPDKVKTRFKNCVNLFFELSGLMIEYFAIVKLKLLIITQIFIVLTFLFNFYLLQYPSQAYSVQGNIHKYHTRRGLPLL